MTPSSGVFRNLEIPGIVSSCHSQRLAFYIPSLAGGGAQRMLINLANEYASRGYPVDLVLLTAEGPYRHLVADGVRIVELGGNRVLFSLRKLSRYLNEVQPTALLSALTHANVVALWARALSGARTRIIVSERNHLTTASRHAHEMIKRRVLPPLVRLFYPWADHVVGISQGVVDDLVTVCRLPATHVSAIHNPVATMEMLSPPAGDVSHPWFGDTSIPTLITAGRLVPQKDHAALLRAFHQVRGRRPVRLLVLGVGELRGELDKQIVELGISDDVAFLGFVEHPEQYMRKADLFVLSSAWEGFGNVLVEALAAGLRIVSTDCPSGPAEILDRGRFGRLVPVADADALAAAILSELDEPPRPERQRKRAASFSVARIADQYLQVLLGSDN